MIPLTCACWPVLPCELVLSFHFPSVLSASIRQDATTIIVATKSIRRLTRMSVPLIKSVLGSWRFANRLKPHEKRTLSPNRTHPHEHMSCRALIFLFCLFIIGQHKQKNTSSFFFFFLIIYLFIIINYYYLLSTPQLSL